MCIVIEHNLVTHRGKPQASPVSVRRERWLPTIDEKVSPPGVTNADGRTTNVRANRGAPPRVWLPTKTRNKTDKMFGMMPSEVTRKALYFPYVKTPEDAWFTRVLLYWDRVGTIVPGGLELDERFVTRRMQELREAELLDFVHPMGAIVSSAERESAFRQNFLDYVDRNELLRSRTANAVPLEFTRIHVFKLGQLANDLEQRGLARQTAPQGTSWELWMDVERHCADLFMAYLAVTLSMDSGAPMDPVTNDLSSMNALLGADTNTGTVLKAVRELRIDVLEELLPAPDASLGVAELARFKREHREQLAGFRQAIDAALISAAAIPEPDAREAQLRLSLSGFVRERDEIAKAMRARRWPAITFGAVAALVGAGGAAVVEAVGGNPVPAVFAGASLVATAYQVLKDALKPAEYLAKPMAYAALVEKTLKA